MCDHTSCRAGPLLPHTAGEGSFGRGAGTILQLIKSVISVFLGNSCGAGKKTNPGPLRLFQAGLVFSATPVMQHQDDSGAPFGPQTRGFHALDFVGTKPPSNTGGFPVVPCLALEGIGGFGGGSDGAIDLLFRRLDHPEWQRFQMKTKKEVYSVLACNGYKSCFSLAWNKWMLSIQNRKLWTSCCQWNAKAKVVKTLTIPDPQSSTLPLISLVFNHHEMR